MSPYLQLKKEKASKLLQRVNKVSFSCDSEKIKRQLKCLSRYRRQLALTSFTGILAVGFNPGKAVTQCTPIGGEFQINDNTTISANDPSVAMDALGNYVVVWDEYFNDGYDTGNYSDVFGRIYNSAGVPQSGVFQINTFTTGAQRDAVVAMDSQGNFVVVWEGRDSYDYEDDVDIFMRRYDAFGTPLDVNEVRVNTYYTDNQRDPAIAMDCNGNFVIVWESEDQDGDDLGIFGRRFDAMGNPIGSEFQVNTITTNDQGDPDIAMDCAGNFVVVWESDHEEEEQYNTFGRRFNAVGTALDMEEFLINTMTQGDQGDPAIAMTPEGNFVVVWESEVDHPDGDDEIYGRRYSADGMALDVAEFRINTITTYDQDDPAVAMDCEGNFVVVWESVFDNEYDLQNSYGRAYYANGNPIDGVEFLINTTETGSQRDPSIAMDHNGNMVVAWETRIETEIDPFQIYGIYGQRYSCEPPVCLEDEIPIPAMSQWGLVILGLFFSILGILGIRQNKHELVREIR